jgi:hypothetical protein
MVTMVASLRVTGSKVVVLWPASEKAAGWCTIPSVAVRADPRCIWVRVAVWPIGLVRTQVALVW